MRKKQFLQFRRAMATLLAVAMIGQNTVMTTAENYVADNTAVVAEEQAQEPEVQVEESASPAVQESAPAAETPAEPAAQAVAEKPAEPKPEKPRAEKAEKPRAEKPAEKKPEIEPMRPLPELSDEIPEAVKPKAELAAAYLTEVIRAMEVKDFTITPKMREDTLVLLIEGSDLGVVIGRRGEGEYVRVKLDSGNFREKRSRTLEELAVKMAKNALRTGRSTTLEPMNPYDRRIIHAAVAGVEGAASTSIGEEPNRRVVISSLNPRKPQQDRRGGHGGRGRRGGRGGDRRRDSRPVENTAVNAEKPAAPKAPLKEAEDKPLYGKIEL